VRVLVCGSRTFSDVIICSMLDGIADRMLNAKSALVIITGMARGADTIAVDWANANGITLHEYPADWERHGRRAGYLRNVEMLERGNPDLVLAFVDKPLIASKGTAMMVNLARRAGVKTYVVEAING